MIENFQREFKDLGKEFIVHALKINTLNLAHTYEYLRKPHQPQIEKSIYSSGDDHVLKYMRDSAFYKELIDLHGKQNIEDREYFLS